MGSTAEQTTNGMPDYSSIKKEGLFRQTWNGLRRNRLAMFGLALIVILVLIAVFADFIAPFGVDEQDLTGKFLKPGGRHPSRTDACRLALKTSRSNPVHPPQRER